MKQGVWKRILAWTMVLLMALPKLTAVPALADARVGTQKVLTLGADLTEDEKQLILRFFDVDESEVVTMTITNADEREHLLGLIPEEQIGTRTFSCALVCPTDRGGIQVTTANMSYVTSELIASTLATSGVTNCDVLTAAPFRVSGTGALTGAMMSYELASGEILDEAKKNLANEELVITNELGDTVGQDEAILIVNGVKIRIAKDQVSGEEEVRGVVDEVVDNAETQLNARAQAQGTAAVQIGQKDRENLYTYGNKFAELDYQYEDMKVTLQRVTENTIEITGITDPVAETFEDLGENAVSGDSILAGVNDDALGDDAGVNSTVDTTYVTVETEAGEPETERATIGEAEQHSEQLAFPVREISLKEVESISDSAIDSLSGAAQFRHRDDNWNYALTDRAGNLLTEHLYTSIYFEKGYFVVKDQNNRAGLLALDGTEVIPCEYDYIPSVKSSWWTAAMQLEKVAADEEDYDVYSGDDHYIFKSVDLYNLKDGGGQPARSLTREEAHSLYATGPILEIDGTYYDRNLNELPENASVSFTGPDGSLYWKVNEEQADYSTLYGVTDSHGEPVLSPVYRTISSFEYGFAEVGKRVGDETRYGLYAAGDNEAVPCAYDWVARTSIGTWTEDDGYVATYSYCPAGYFRATNEDTLEYVAWGGEVTGRGPLTRDQLEYIGGASCSYVDENGLRHVYSADGYDVAYPEEYTYLHPLDDVGLFWYAENDDYQYYLYDFHGNLMLDEPADSSFRISGDGRYIVWTGNHYGEYKVYEVTYHTDGGDLHGYQTGLSADAVSSDQEAEETDVTQTEAPQQSEASDTAAETEAAAVGETPAAQTEESPAEVSAEAADASAAVALLDSAVLLMEQDISANASSAAELIRMGADMIRSSAPGAAAVLDSANLLLTSGGADLSSVKTLIDTAKGML